MLRRGDNQGAGYVFAIIGVASALVVLIIGASTIAAVGHEVPRELWAIGGALGGALVGILAPPPHRAGGREATPAAAAYRTHDAAVKAAREKAQEIERSEEKTRTSAAWDALLAVEKMRGTLKTQLTGTAAASSVAQRGQAYRAATMAVELQSCALKGAKEAVKQTEHTLAQGTHGETTAAVTSKRTEMAERQAALDVYRAAFQAASGAAQQASEREAGWFSAIKTIATEPKLLVPVILLAVVLTLGILLSTGVIHATKCPLEKLSESKHHETTPTVKASTYAVKRALEPQCAYYATATKQAATVMISLAGALVGALVGMFAAHPQSSKPTGAQSGG